MKTQFLKVVSAEYFGGLSLRLTFSDAIVKIIDFSGYLMNHPHPQHDKFLSPAEFKKFSIENGNVVWGKDWDLIFSVEDLYKGDIFK